MSDFDVYLHLTNMQTNISSRTGLRNETNEYVKRSCPGSPSDRSLGKIPFLPLFLHFLDWRYLWFSYMPIGVCFTIPTSLYCFDTASILLQSSNKSWLLMSIKRLKRGPCPCQGQRAPLYSVSCVNRNVTVRTSLVWHGCFLCSWWRGV